MKVVALVSGGKDSCYNMMECIRHGHEIVAIGNLHPPENSPDEMDSFMFQTVGHQIIQSIANAMELPLYRAPLMGSSVHTDLNYTVEEGKDRDEIEDLEVLLRKVKKEHPEITAVSTGAILSNYQRARVENICGKLGLTSLCYLWEREQIDLLDEMIQSEVDAVLIKVAMIGLTSKYLTKSLKELQNTLLRLNVQYDINVCGEGGEYETLTLNCPLFKKRIVVEEWSFHGDLSETMAPVAHATPVKMVLVDKTSEEIEKDKLLLQPIAKPGSRQVLEGQEWLTTYVQTNTSSVTHQDDVPSSTKNLDLQTPVSSWKPRDNAQFVFTSSANAVSILQQHQHQLKSGEEPLVNESLTEVLGRVNVSAHKPLYCNLVINDMNSFASINSEYVQSMPSTGPPARACVQGYPLLDTRASPSLSHSNVETNTNANTNTEINSHSSLHTDMVADVLNIPANSSDAVYLHVQSVSKWAPANIGPYAQAWSTGGVTVFSGQIGMVPQFMDFCDYPEGELEYAFLNTLSAMTGFNCAKRCLSSCAIYLSTQFLNNTQFVYVLRELCVKYNISLKNASNKDIFIGDVLNDVDMNDLTNLSETVIDTLMHFFAKLCRVLLTNVSKLSKPSNSTSNPTSQDELPYLPTYRDVGVSASSASSEEPSEYSDEEDDDIEIPDNSYSLLKPILNHQFLPPLHTTVEHPQFTSVAPLSFITVPCLPKNAHIEVQAIGLSDVVVKKMEDFAGVQKLRQIIAGRVVEGKFQQLQEGDDPNQEGVFSLVISGFFSKEKFIDLTAHIYTDQKINQTNLNNVIRICDEFIHDSILTTGLTYDYTNYNPEKKYTPTVLKNYGNIPVNNSISCDVVRSRIIYDQSLSASALSVAFVPLNSPLSQSTLVPNYTTKLNSFCALEEIDNYTKYMDSNIKSLQRTQSNLLGDNTPTNVLEQFNIVKNTLTVHSLSNDSKKKCIASIQLVLASLERLNCHDENDEE